MNSCISQIENRELNHSRRFHVFRPFRKCAKARILHQRCLQGWEVERWLRERVHFVTEINRQLLLSVSYLEVILPWVVTKRKFLSVVSSARCAAAQVRIGTFLRGCVEVLEWAVLLFYCINRVVAGQSSPIRSAISRSWWRQEGMMQGAMDFMAFTL